MDRPRVPGSLGYDTEGGNLMKILLTDKEYRQAKTIVTADREVRLDRIIEECGELIVVASHMKRGVGKSPSPTQSGMSPSRPRP